MAVAVVGYACGLILSTLFASIAISAGHYHVTSSTDQPLPVTVAELIGLWIGLVGAAVWWSRIHGSGSLSADLGFRVGQWWDIVVGAATGVGAQYAISRWLYLPVEKVDHNVTRQLGQPTERLVGTAHNYGTVALLLLFLAIGAPIVEELFFRGLLQRSLAAWTNPAVAITASSLLFALAHFEAVQFLGLAVFGAILGTLAWRLGRLAPSMAAHAAFNAYAVLSIVHLH